jgi:predicted DNA-binding protein
MALNMVTDKEFDEALAWLAQKESKTKSELVRELVLEKFVAKRSGFRFGALAAVAGSGSGESMQRELKALDEDHDLD